MQPGKEHNKAMQQDVQKCAVCKGDITGKPIKRMGNLYCSVYCAEVNRECMEKLDMENDCP